MDSASCAAAAARRPYCEPDLDKGAGPYPAPTRSAAAAWWERHLSWLDAPAVEPNMYEDTTDEPSSAFSGRRTDDGTPQSTHHPSVLHPPSVPLLTPVLLLFAHRRHVTAAVYAECQRVGGLDWALAECDIVTLRRKLGLPIEPLVREERTRMHARRLVVLLSLPAAAACCAPDVF